MITVDYAGLKGLKNGELLRRAAAQEVDVLITLDSAMQFTQRATDLPVSVVVVRANSNRIDDLRPIVPAILDCLRHLGPRMLVHVP